MAVKIVTDSTADLPRELAAEHGITVVPLNVHFGERDYKDGVDLGPDAFYGMLSDGSQPHPKTSQPSPEDFKKVYEELLADGSEVISIHISAKMSGTFQSATLAKNEIGSDKLTLIDSRFVSMALGLMAVECAAAAARGASAAEIVSLAENIRDKMQVYFIVDTLDCLQRGGRIGKASAIIGGLLNIKPILSVRGGEVVPFEKVRGSAKVFARMANLFAGYLTESRYATLRVGLVHAGRPDLLKKLTDKIDTICKTDGALVSQIGPVVGTHAGPGTVGIFFYKE